MTDSLRVVCITSRRLDDHHCCRRCCCCRFPDHLSYKALSSPCEARPQGRAGRRDSTTRTPTIHVVLVRSIDTCSPSETRLPPCAIMRAARAARHAENNDLTLTIATSKSVPSATTLANLAGTSSRADPCKTGSSSGRPRPSPPMKWNASAATPPSSETVAVRRRRGVFSRRVGGRVNGRATPRRGTGSSRRDDDDDDARQRSNRDGATAGGQFPLPYPGIDGPRPPRPARKLRENLPGPGATRIMHEGAENRDDVVDPAARPKKYSRKRPRSAIAQKLTAAVPSAPGSMGAEVVMPTPVDSRQYHCGDSRRCRTGEERREVSNCQGEHHQRKRNAR